MSNRDLGEVIDQIIALLPENQTGLVEILQSAKSSYAFCSPEMIGYWWNHTADILGEEFPTDENSFEDWHKRVINLWTTEEIFPEVADAKDTRNH